MWDALHVLRAAGAKLSTHSTFSHIKTVNHMFRASNVWAEYERDGPLLACCNYWQMRVQAALTRIDVCSLPPLPPNFTRLLASLRYQHMFPPPHQLDETQRGLPTLLYLSQNWKSFCVVWCVVIEYTRDYFFNGYFYTCQMTQRKS
jgi:hypothetical protein